ncbi:hypothetical protein NEFER03_1241 [Nematocida sp. LUAm3]|nr:hypothetical protein NEFER03_1241 [Nematocida sp. LUAm3]KAI5175850.1 hypothetical protein NEFER02_1719 [Nematocida sp. LUAm2]KAI5178346.1 hypothetical protein NEFER01_1513 [Nematocida sp. LUAm1]
MDYQKIKTRLKDKLTKEYKKTKYSDEFLQTEKNYKKVREGVKLLEVELGTILEAFSTATLYENITNGFYSGLEMVKGSIKKDNKQKPVANKEEADLFGVFAMSLGNLAECTSEDVSKKFSILSLALKKTSAARFQMKDGLKNVIHVITEIKEQSKAIDETRLKLLEARQTAEAAKDEAEEERLRRSFEENCSKVLEEMNSFVSSHELSEICNGISMSLKTFFADAYDVLAEGHLGIGTPK